jgi:hypothetical protein
MADDKAGEYRCTPKRKERAERFESYGNVLEYGAAVPLSIPFFHRFARKASPMGE